MRIGAVGKGLFGWVGGTATAVSGGLAIQRLWTGGSEDRWADRVAVGGSLCGIFTIASHLLQRHRPLRMFVASAGLVLDAFDLARIGWRWEQGQLTTGELLIQGGLLAIFGFNRPQPLPDFRIFLHRQEVTNLSLLDKAFSDLVSRPVRAAPLLSRLQFDHPDARLGELYITAIESHPLKLRGIIVPKNGDEEIGGFALELNRETGGGEVFAKAFDTKTDPRFTGHGVCTSSFVSHLLFLKQLGASRLHATFSRQNTAFWVGRGYVENTFDLSDRSPCWVVLRRKLAEHGREDLLPADLGIPKIMGGSDMPPYQKLWGEFLATLPEGHFFRAENDAALFADSLLPPLPEADRFQRLLSFVITEARGQWGRYPPSLPEERDRWWGFIRTVWDIDELRVLPPFDSRTRRSLDWLEKEFLQNTRPPLRSSLPHHPRGGFDGVTGEITPRPPIPRPVSTAPSGSAIKLLETSLLHPQARITGVTVDGGYFAGPGERIVIGYSDDSYRPSVEPPCLTKVAASVEVPMDPAARIQLLTHGGAEVFADGKRVGDLAYLDDLFMLKVDGERFFVLRKEFDLSPPIPSPTPAEMRFHTVWLKSNDQQTSFESVEHHLDGDRLRDPSQILLGRSNDADFRFELDDHRFPPMPRHISRHHAALTPANGSWFVQNLSDWGTYVQQRAATGEVIGGPDRWVRVGPMGQEVRSGDSIRLGPDGPIFWLSVTPREAATVEVPRVRINHPFDPNPLIDSLRRAQPPDDPIFDRGFQVIGKQPGDPLTIQETIDLLCERLKNLGGVFHVELAELRERGVTNPYPLLLDPTQGFTTPTYLPFAREFRRVVLALERAGQRIVPTDAEIAQYSLGSKGREIVAKRREAWDLIVEVLDQTPAD